MTNAALLSLLPLLAGWMAYRAWKEGRSWFARPALALGVAALCCVPWTIRNYTVFHAFVPFRSTLGLQLWMGNNAASRDVWLGEGHPIHSSAERAKYVELGEIAYMQEKREEAIRYMLTHPLREAHLIGHRFIALWSGGTPNPLSDFFRYHSLWFRSVLLFNILAAIGALLGIVVLIRRRNTYAFPAAVFPLVFPWVYYATLALPRYRLPIDPIVLLLAAVALQRLVQRLALNASRKMGSAVA
jgi:hypothetical protein